MVAGVCCSDVRSMLQWFSVHIIKVCCSYSTVYPRKCHLRVSQGVLQYVAGLQKYVEVD